MPDEINLNQLIPIYRRDTDEVTGAVRMNTIEMVSMEQMPGGRFQVVVKTSSAGQYFVTPVLLNLYVGRHALEAYRARIGGEEPMYPVPEFVPQTGLDETDLPVELPKAFSVDGPFDESLPRALRFHRPKSARKTRARIVELPYRSCSYPRLREYAGLTVPGGRRAGSPAPATIS